MFLLQLQQTDYYTVAIYVVLLRTIYISIVILTYCLYVLMQEMFQVTLQFYCTKLIKQLLHVLMMIM